MSSVSPQTSKQVVTRYHLRSQRPKLTHSMSVFFLHEVQNVLKKVNEHVYAYSCTKNEQKLIKLTVVLEQK